MLELCPIIAKLQKVLDTGDMTVLPSIMDEFDTLSVEARETLFKLLEGV